MSDRPLHPDFDDELLSAYLDDELSADERAAVEARLADDPAARQLLDQLRAVSQSVQSLPEESLGHDLRASVLQRAETAKRDIRALADPPAALKSSASNGAPSLLEGDPIPRISIGRSPRSWIWASLAVAAALLIMFKQSGDENQGNLPAVAQRTDDVTREVAAAKATDGSSADESLTAAPASGAAASSPPAESAPPASAVASDEAKPGLASTTDSKSRSMTRSGQLGATREAGQAGAPLAASSPRAANESELRDESRGEPTTLGGAAMAKAPRGKIGELGAGGEHSLDGDSATRPDEAQEVVVRIVAKRAALDNKLIDQLLVKNGIAVDADQPADEKSHKLEASGRGLDEQDKLATAAEQAAQQPAPSFQAECDVVVVDAPQKAILSCVSELNRDLANYTSVEVDDAAAALDTNKDKQRAPTILNNQAANDLRQFNRGTVPEQQKESFARNQQFYFQQLSDEERARNSTTLSYGVNPDQKKLALKEQTELVDRANQNTANQGRAYRFSNSNVQNRFSEEQLTRNAPTDEAIVSGAYKQRAMLPDAKAANKLADENLRVWFFICPEEPMATSAPSAIETK